MTRAPHAGPDDDDDDGPGIVTDEPPVDVGPGHPEPVTVGAAP